MISTRFYYIVVFLTVPFMLVLMGTSSLNILVAGSLGLIAQAGFTAAGFILGRRAEK